MFLYRFDFSTNRKERKQKRLDCSSSRWRDSRLKNHRIRSESEGDTCLPDSMPFQFRCQQDNIPKVDLKDVREYDRFTCLYLYSYLHEKIFFRKNVISNE